jgi:hypothetical protein
MGHQTIADLKAKLRFLGTYQDPHDPMRQVFINANWFRAPERDIELVGCLYKDELYNGSSFRRSKKGSTLPVIEPTGNWWEGQGIAFPWGRHEPTGPSWIDFRETLKDCGESLR